MRRLRPAVAALCLATMGLTACGQETPEATPEPTITSATPSATPTAKKSRDPLADAVEDLAKDMTPSAESTTDAPDPEVSTKDVETNYGLKDPTYGSDISWPQCPKGAGSVKGREGLGMPMPKKEWKFVVIGLTNGPAMTQNPCLADQLAWAKKNKVLVSAYAVATYPSDDQLAQFGTTGPYDASTTEGKLSNWGYAQGVFNIKTLQDVNLPVPALWIDVEPVPSPPLVAWSKDTAANALVVQGISRAYREADYRIGIYSTPNLWRTVVGKLRLGYPEWRAAGPTSEKEAVRRCRGESIQGGQAVLGQWVEDRRDRNVTCPYQVGQLANWFILL
ncbi:hypothetical protein BJ980_002084 [Nocardioides daedukensis]|uniref:DUF1906 domain-containing protein n=1 Tax=Nocardioides daedukensis TaxID=634462 RepID=A0A7Y9S0Z3_9ACTN|nr:hypothetical protein [Nocardioides daedukensis]NYG59161.1 hypothetical protein [Nocardioides daedukensis]